MGIRGVDHVALTVRDLDETLTFMQGVLGLELRHATERTPGADRFGFLRCGPVTIELIELADPAEREARLGDGQVRLDHLALDVDDLAATRRELAASGVRFQTAEPVDHGAGPTISTTGEGDDGIVLQLVQRRRRD